MAPSTRKRARVGTSRRSRSKRSLSKRFVDLPRVPGAKSRSRMKLPTFGDLQARFNALKVVKTKLTPLERKGMELATLVQEQEKYSDRVGNLEKRILRLAGDIQGDKKRGGGSGSGSGSGSAMRLK